MEEFTLEWSGPYTFRQLIADSELRNRWNIPGVYVWIDNACSSPVLSYVGRAKGSPTLSYRQLQHYMLYVGGSYHIPGYARKTGLDWSLDLRKEGVTDVILNLDSLLKLTEEGYKYANALDIYLAPADPEILTTLERNLLYDLCPTDTHRGTKTRPRPALHLVHKNAVWATDVIRKQVRAYVEFI